VRTVPDVRKLEAVAVLADRTASSVRRIRSIRSPITAVAAEFQLSCLTISCIDSILLYLRSLTALHDLVLRCVNRLKFHEVINKLFYRAMHCTA